MSDSLFYIASDTPSNSGNKQVIGLLNGSARGNAVLSPKDLSADHEKWELQARGSNLYVIKSAVSNANQTIFASASQASEGAVVSGNRSATTWYLVLNFRRQCQILTSDQRYAWALQENGPNVQVVLSSDMNKAVWWNLESA